jgi:hypothetical protein
MPEPGPAGERLTFWQRLVCRRPHSIAGKPPAEPLTPDDWEGFSRCPQALIDKLIRDEVMVLYIPMLGRLRHPEPTMLDHARELLGEAFVGNIGERWLLARRVTVGIIGSRA